MAERAVTKRKQKRSAKAPDRGKVFPIPPASYIVCDALHLLELADCRGVTETELTRVGGAFVFETHLGDGEYACVASDPGLLRGKRVMCDRGVLGFFPRASYAAKVEACPVLKFMEAFAMQELTVQSTGATIAMSSPGVVVVADGPTETKLDTVMEGSGLWELKQRLCTGKKKLGTVLSAYMLSKLMLSCGASSADVEAAWAATAPLPKRE